MRRLKRWLLTLLTLALVVVGAAMPWAVFRIQDTYGGSLQEERSLDSMRLTLRQESDLAQSMRLMATDEYYLTDLDREPALTRQQALEKALDALNWMVKCGLLEQESLYGVYGSQAYADPWVMVCDSMPGVSSVVWDCSWPDGGMYHVRIDDATGKLLVAVMETPELVYPEDVYIRLENWVLFLGDHYGLEVQDIKETADEWWDVGAEFLMSLDLGDDGSPLWMEVNRHEDSSSMAPYIDYATDAELERVPLPDNWSHAAIGQSVFDANSMAIG